MLIIMAGLPGTGKSSVAAQLASRMDAVILNKDTVRHALFPPALVEYSTTQDDFVIDVLLRTAMYIWSKYPVKTIVLDGRTFSQESQRQHVIGFAERARQRRQIVECVCADEVAKERLSRGDPAHPAGNRTVELYDEVMARWEPFAEEHVIVRTDAPIDYDGVVSRLTR